MASVRLGFIVIICQCLASDEMQPKRQKKIIIVVSIIFGSSLAVGFILYALRQNVNLYYTPSQVAALTEKQLREIRIGGLVVKGSVKHIPNSLKVDFTLTDHYENVRVHYEGILPALFREGQGIIVQGELKGDDLLVADQVLAKHDEKYKPPEINP